MTKPRPGTPFHPDEPLAAILGDAADTLETVQVPDPRPELERVIASLRFVVRTLEKRFRGPEQ